MASNKRVSSTPKVQLISKFSLNPKTKKIFAASLAIMLVVSVGIFALNALVSQAADTGFFSANSTISENSVSNEDEGWTSDDDYATFNNNTDTADYGFPDLGIPTGKKL